MDVTPASISDIKLIEPACHGDDRGYLFESYSRRRYAEQAGIEFDFVQDNHSFSVRGVLRGLHYQLQRPQGKLVRVIRGEIFDVGVDIRAGSSNFGRWSGVRLSAENRRQLWIPPGFAHGFYVLSDAAEVLYKATAYYDPDDEYCLAWNDSDVAVDWPCAAQPPIVSARDLKGLPLAEIPRFP
jgi:dTDP-4-dehydrorhamnose 3,5-epimerase